MSILGYSSSYFLPEYWSNTPLYGERIIPLIDYILSNDYVYSEKLAQAYYNITSKYKNPQDLSIDFIKAIIEESGYSYVLDLLGNNEESIRLLINLVTMIHQLKGTKIGIIAVLNLLRKESNIMTMKVIGKPTISADKVITDITVSDYVVYDGFSANSDSLELGIKVEANNFTKDQCILSVSDYGLYIGTNTYGNLVLSLSSNRLSWNIAENVRSNKTLSPGKEYWVRLMYDGYEYYLQVSTDGDNYTTWISVESTSSLNINSGTLFLGVDGSGTGISKPLDGAINYSAFSIDVTNIEITQWFEQSPVGEEDTFLITTDLDVDLVSSDFFKNFSNFIKNYVYPSLEAFTAYLNFNTSLTFLPYVREKVDYIAMSTLVAPIVDFLVKEDKTSTIATDDFDVLTALGDYVDFNVIAKVDVVSASKDKYIITEGNASGLFEAGDKVLFAGSSETSNNKKVTIVSMTYTESSNTTRVEVEEELVDSTGGALWKLS